ncbi:hypothetical protein Syun_014225 [Stephania yunnanensis]|uniref:Uncharacterized protein n=1 Tax=Stephania yunnanensis TaxID=152371 RepID=A0AAP0JL23_9MAGN
MGRHDEEDDEKRGYDEDDEGEEDEDVDDEGRDSKDEGDYEGRYDEEEENDEEGDDDEGRYDEERKNDEDRDDDKAKDDKEGGWVAKGCVQGDKGDDPSNVDHIGGTKGHANIEHGPPGSQNGGKEGRTSIKHAQLEEIEQT